MADDANPFAQNQQHAANKKSSDQTVAGTSPTGQNPSAPVVQYVVQEKSLTGLGGWLIFWMILFGLYSVSFLIAFFICLAGTVEAGLPSGAGGAIVVETMIFGVLICVAYVLATIFIALQKKIARLLSFISIGLTSLYIIVICFTAMAIQSCHTSYSYDYLYPTSQQVCSGIGAGGVILLVGVILGALIYTGLVSLYFIMSKRVKQTLIK